MGPTDIDEVIGVSKAYVTRVGEGPFPTEQVNEIGDKIRQAGKEFGSTTGRPRRCGWLDIPALRYAIRLNGISSLILTKLDVLTGFEQLKLCVGYEYEGSIISEMPYDAMKLDEIKPIYEKFPGWKEDISMLRIHDALPEQAKHFLQWIEMLCNCPISMVSVGPERDQIIKIRDTLS
jgi:adenylosuccinate synthase